MSSPPDDAIPKSPSYDHDQYEEVQTNFPNHDTNSAHGLQRHTPYESNLQIYPILPENNLQPNARLGTTGLGDVTNNPNMDLETDTYNDHQQDPNQAFITGQPETTPAPYHQNQQGGGGAGGGGGLAQEQGPINPPHTAANILTGPQERAFQSIPLAQSDPHFRPQPEPQLALQTNVLPPHPRGFSIPPQTLLQPSVDTSSYLPPDISSVIQTIDKIVSCYRDTKLSGADEEKTTDFHTTAMKAVLALSYPFLRTNQQHIEQRLQYFFPVPKPPTPSTPHQQGLLAEFPIPPSQQVPGQQQQPGLHDQQNALDEPIQPHHQHHHHHHGQLGESIIPPVEQVYAETTQTTLPHYQQERSDEPPQRGLSQTNQAEPLRRKPGARVEPRTRGQYFAAIIQATLPYLDKPSGTDDGPLLLCGLITSLGDTGMLTLTRLRTLICIWKLLGFPDTERLQKIFRFLSTSQTPDSNFMQKHGTELWMTQFPSLLKAIAKPSEKNREGGNPKKYMNCNLIGLLGHVIHFACSSVISPAYLDIRASHVRSLSAKINIKDYETTAMEFLTKKISENKLILEDREQFRTIVLPVWIRGLSMEFAGRLLKKNDRFIPSLQEYLSSTKINHFPWLTGILRDMALDTLILIHDGEGELDKLQAYVENCLRDSSSSLQNNDKSLLLNPQTPNYSNTVQNTNPDGHDDDDEEENLGDGGNEDGDNSFYSNNSNPFYSMLTAARDQSRSLGVSIEEEKVEQPGRPNPVKSSDKTKSLISSNVSIHQTSQSQHQQPHSYQHQQRNTADTQQQLQQQLKISSSNVVSTQPTSQPQQHHKPQTPNPKMVSTADTQQQPQQQPKFSSSNVVSTQPPSQPQQQPPRMVSAADTHQQPQQQKFSSSNPYSQPSMLATLPNSQQSTPLKPQPSMLQTAQTPNPGIQMQQETNEAVMKKRLTYIQNPSTGSATTNSGERVFYTNTQPNLGNNSRS